ncbi:MAG: hypothetical protein K2K25_12205 [Muribaculaceae bacterium]|nr:hypothetical protein [Muribaculaceae bacterium]
MSNIKKLNDLLKSLPTASYSTGKSVVLIDGNGEPYKIDNELGFFKYKCRCLFGTDKVHIVRREGYNNYYSIAQWKNYTNISTGWSVTMNNSSEGDIVVVIATSLEGKAVTLYTQCTADGNYNNRFCLGLMVEIEGYQPLWASRITPP